MEACVASDYISELAARAYLEIKEAGPQAEEILRCLPEKPTSAIGLEQQITPLPSVQARIAWSLHYTPSKWLLGRELEVVNQRREKTGIFSVEQGQDAYESAHKSGLMGLCFSGGGIRSATFNLGVLQGLAELKLLRCFDYLSSVSGGGYIHQWLAAWGKREGFDKVNEKLVPLPDPGSAKSHPEPIRWLRRYSNYLTPEKGFFTADTWVTAAMWLRNTLLNQIILITALLTVMLLPHALAMRHIGRGIPAAIAVGIILYLFLMATLFTGQNLFRFDLRPAKENGLFGQSSVQLAIVLPLLASSLLFVLLFPVRSAFLFGFHVILCFLVSCFLLLVLTLTTVFAGNVLLCYLRTQHGTEHFNSFREFWRQRPRCKAHLKAFFVILGLLAACLIASASGALWVALTDTWMARLWACSGEYWWKLIVVIDPPLVMMGVLLALLVLTAFLGRLSDNKRREWLSRLAAWMGLYSAMWVGFVGLSLFGAPIFHWLRVHLAEGIPALITWIGSTGLGVLAGSSSRTTGVKNDQAPSKFNPLEIVAAVGPFIFVAGLLLLLSALAEVSLQAAHGYGWWAVPLVFFVPPLLCYLFASRVDINEFSMHAYYRDRLARCYLGASNDSRDPNPFTGFDSKDAEIAVSRLQPPHYYGPFPIFDATLNLTFGEDLAWQERKAASFVFTPLYSGYDVGWTSARGETKLRYSGFVKTEEYAYPKPGIHVSTAAAISGAALSPSMGFHSNSAIAFLLTVFNVRLGWWLVNPRKLDEEGRLLREKDVDAGYPRKPFAPAAPRFSLLYLLSELFGLANDERQYVYLSDGGHFENTGLYELVRRRCRYIVICDAEGDAQQTFEGIGMAIRKCRIDFGAEIALDLRPLQFMDDTEYSKNHCVVGTITYPEAPQDQGIVVYLTSSLTGDEPADIVNYKKQNPAFPNDSTVNQWFTESQFESYRRLGHHVSWSVFEPGRPMAHDCATRQGRSSYFWTLRGIWPASTPEMDLYSAEHSRRYEVLLKSIREDSLLPDFYDRLYGPPADNPNWDGNWENGKTEAQIKRARTVSSDLFQFMFLVYRELNLVFPEKRNHPFSQGWYRIFKNWTKIDAVRESWKTYCGGYSESFRLFAQEELNLPNPSERMRA
jgi:Patatin-like phospholipase